MGLTMASDARINIEVPKALGNHADERVKRGDFSSKAEYIRYLIRRDLENTDARQRQIDYFNARIERSFASGISKKTPSQIKAHLEETIKKAATSRNKK